MTKRERQLMRTSLQLAIDDRKALVDCYHTAWSKIRINGQYEKVVGEADRPYVRSQQRLIKRFERLLAKLSE
jgi:hypothetical protein